MFWPFRSAQDRLDDAAAEWLTRMRGEERDGCRDAFERWYHADPAHAHAYDDALAAFRESGILAQGGLASSRSLPAPARQVAIRYAFAATIVAALVSAVLLSSSRMMPPPVPAAQTARYATNAGETRAIDLPDGSRMTLGDKSVAEVAFDGRERLITLGRGTGRFSVSHEARPFRVKAGEAEVVAHGTLFDVSLTGEGTRVSLIEGSVEVSYPARAKAVPRHVARGSPRQFDVLVNTGSSSAPARPGSPGFAGTIAFFGPAMAHMRMAQEATFAVPLPRTPQLFSFSPGGASLPLSIRVVASHGNGVRNAVVSSVTIVAP